MKREDFLAAVKHEIKQLKIHATPDEISRLDLQTFDSGNVRLCVYGQMTGNCESPRAKELMDKACLVETEYGYTPLKDGMDIVAYTGKTWNIPYRRYLHFSALELYIQMPDCNTPRIINYMQGKTQRLYI